MNQTLISRLVVGALATLAVTSSFAGQIQSSSLSIAREVITSDSQTITSPSISYRFAGDIDARQQAQTFQVQFTLTGGGLWDKGAMDATTISMTDQQGTAAITQGAAIYQVNTIALSSDSKTLYATITVAKGAADGANIPTVGVIHQPLISVSTGAVAKNPLIKKLFSVVGAVTECDTTVKTLPVSFKHYVGLQDPTALATDANATKDEHNRSGAQNETMLMTFPTNILVTVKPSIGDAKLDSSSANTKFTGTWPVATATDATKYIFNSYLNSNTLVNLGAVYFKQTAVGYDSNLQDKYLLGSTIAPAGIKALTAAVEGNAAAALAGGDVEAKAVNINVTASQGFVNKGKVFLSALADCSAGLASPAAAVTFDTTTATQPVTLSLTTQADFTAAFGAAGTSPVFVCYQANVANGYTIPSSTFTVTAATLSKAPGDTVTYPQEQDNYCKGTLYPLSGSLKIDVRNYVANGNKDGWMSVIRLINNSEVNTVDVYGQYIQASGLYGNYGLLATLKPRQALNMTSAAIDAKLVNAPIHPTAANNATTATDGNDASNSRLRITAVNGDTLRVQNYLYNPKNQNFIEASSSEGVDFSSVGTRAQTASNLNDQDAQVGLNGGN